MRYILEELWLGRIIPGPNCGVGDYEIEKASALAERNLEALNQITNSNQKELLQKYVDCANSYCDLLAAQAFRDGFSLATQLMAESFCSHP